MQWFVRAVAVIGFLILIRIGVCIYLGVTAADNAERTLHAVNLVTVVVDTYMQEEGRWPKSWEEIRRIEAVDAPSMYSWPEDAEIVHEFVSIDFNADVKKIASQTVEDFEAISPNGSYYPYKKYGFVASLIESAKAVSNDRPESRMAQ